MNSVKANFGEAPSGHLRKYRVAIPPACHSEAYQGTTTKRRGLHRLPDHPRQIIA